MQNKKGFTLVELLSVIVLLVVIMTLATAGIQAARKSMNKKMFESKIDAALQAAKTWGQDNKSQISSDTTKTIWDLINLNYLTTDEVISSCDSSQMKNNKCYVVTNNVTDKVVNNLVIKIYTEQNRVYSCVVNNTDNQNLLGDDYDYTDSLCN